MAADVWTQDELFEGLEPSPGFISELERLGLLVVVARDGQGQGLYGPEAREELEKVLELVELGYQPEDIAAIAKRVGLPVKRRRRFQKPPVYLSIAEVVARTGVSTDQLARWRELRLVSPGLRVDDDEALYELAMVTRVERLRDLQVLGASEEELSAWSLTLTWLDTRYPQGEMSSEEALSIEATLHTLRGRLDVLAEVRRRWRRLIALFEKRLSKVRPDQDGKGSRGRRRRKTRTPR